MTLPENGLVSYPENQLISGSPSIITWYPGFCDACPTWIPPYANLLSDSSNTPTPTLPKSEVLLIHSKLASILKSLLRFKFPVYLAPCSNVYVFGFYSVTSLLSIIDADSNALISQLLPIKVRSK